MSFSKRAHRSDLVPWSRLSISADECATRVPTEPGLHPENHAFLVRGPMPADGAGSTSTAKAGELGSGDDIMAKAWTAVFFVALMLAGTMASSFLIISCRRLRP